MTGKLKDSTLNIFDEISSDIYLKRYAHSQQLFDPKKLKSTNYELIVVIPSYAENLKNLKKTLDSLNASQSSNHDEILIIVIINESEIEENKNAIVANKKCLQMLETYESNYDLCYSYQILPEKKAGVGLARKIGMDEAVRIFSYQKKEGIIVSLDADCTCQKNYFQSIKRAFFKDNIQAGVVYYEHPLDSENQEEIIKYELFLRYYIQSLKYAKYPHAYQTLGSCIVVHSTLYKKSGGMSIKKAGEDFYFINKICSNKNFKEVKSTTVYPSPRISFRVPFGTGLSIKKIKMNSDYKIYNPNIFNDLYLFLSKIHSNNFNNTPKSINHFLNYSLLDYIKDIRYKTNGTSSFLKKFFEWFDLLKVLKYTHFCAALYYPNVKLETAINWLLKNHNISNPEHLSDKDKLLILRKVDKMG